MNCYLLLATPNTFLRQRLLNKFVSSLIYPVFQSFSENPSYVREEELHLLANLELANMPDIVPGLSLHSTSKLLFVMSSYRLIAHEEFPTTGSNTSIAATTNGYK